MNRNKALLTGTLAAICGLGYTAEGLDRQFVTVRGLNLLPMGQFSYNNDRTVLHPNVFVSLGYDSNAYQVEDDETTAFTQEAVAGIDIQHFLNESSLLELELDVGYKNYIGDDDDARGLEMSDKSGLLVNADLEYVKEGAVWLHNASIRGRLYDDPTVESGLSVRRMDYGAQYEAEYGGLFARIPTMAFFEGVIYDEDGYEFRDRNRYGLQSGMDYDRSETSTIGGRIRGFQTMYSESNTPWQDSLSVRAFGSWDVVVEDLHEFTAQLGVEWRSFEDDFAEDPTYDDESVITPIAMLDYGYLYDTESRLKAKLQRTIEDGFNSNYVEINMVSVGATKRLYSDWELLGGLSYYLRNASGDTDSNSLTGKLGASYFFRQGMALRGLITYRTQESETGSFDSDWGQMLANIDFAAAF